MKTEPTYRCDKTKDEIIKIVVKHFHTINRAYEAHTYNDMDTGAYRAMIGLLQELKIYENGGEEE